MFQTSAYYLTKASVRGSLYEPYKFAIHFHSVYEPYKFSIHFQVFHSVFQSFLDFLVEKRHFLVEIFQKVPKNAFFQKYIKI